jgi:hypothetical protein
MEVKIEANNDKHDVHRVALLSRVDMHQAKTETIKEEMKTNIKITKKR